MRINLLSRARKKRELGFTSVEVMLGICLILVPTGLLTLSIPHFFSYQQFTSSVATELARTLATDPQANETTITNDIAANYNINPSTVTIDGPLSSFASIPEPSLDQVIVTLVYLDQNGAPVNDVERGGSVEVDTRIKTEMVPVPWIKSELSGVVSSRYVEDVDKYGSFQ